MENLEKRMACVECEHVVGARRRTCRDCGGRTFVYVEPGEDASDLCRSLKALAARARKRLTPYCATADLPSAALL